MTRWANLSGAILAEVSATLALRAAVDQPWWYLLTVVGYTATFGLLALALDAGIPVGVAYGIWAATGVALTALLAVPLFGEALSATMAAGVALILAGVVLVEVGSHRGSQRAWSQAAEDARC